MNEDWTLPVAVDALVITGAMLEFAVPPVTIREYTWLLVVSAPSSDTVIV